MPPVLLYALHPVARLVIGLALLLGLQTAQAAVSLQAPSAYLAQFTTHPPILDGRLDDPVWQQAPFTSAYVDHATGRAAPVRTRAKLVYDDEYLYLGVATEDADIYAWYSSNQAPLFRRDDLIEIFIDPVGQGRNYLELGASAAGFYYSLRIPQAVDGRVQPQPLPLQDIALATHFNGTLNDASDRDKSWSIEVKIPLADIALASGAPLSFTTAWRLGLFRIDYDHNTPEWKALGFYSWQNHGRFSFHRPERFGFLQFAPTGPLKKS